MKNSLAVILFSIECSSCTRLAPNTRENRALKRRVDEFLTYRECTQQGFIFFLSWGRFTPDRKVHGCTLVPRPIFPLIELNGW